MQVKIETYRGWDISFDTETEKFYSESNEWDRKIRSFFLHGAILSPFG